MDETPIDLTAERNRRQEPDAKHVRQDDYGRPLYRFAIEYGMGSDRWGTDVWAYDHDDAVRRLDAIKRNGVIVGQVFTSIPI